MYSVEFSLLHSTMDALISTLENNESWIPIFYSAYFELLASPGHHVNHIVFQASELEGNHEAGQEADGDDHQPKGKLVKKNGQTICELTLC
jgi:hypothetical protein